MSERKSRKRPRKQDITKTNKRAKIYGKRRIGDVSIFDEIPPVAENWEKMYREMVNPKYQKGKRRFNEKSKLPKPMSTQSLPPIFVVPRVRGGPSYKQVNLAGIPNPETDVFFAPASKGFSGQDLSSFTEGPFVNEGLCLINAAASKAISVCHIQGGGRFDPSRKDFWAPGSHPARRIQVYDNTMVVDGQRRHIQTWLREQKALWYDEWLKWSRAVALCSEGSFRWNDASIVVMYFKASEDKYMNFVQWKNECYIEPGIQWMKQTKAFKYLFHIWFEKKIPLALVHPKGYKHEAIHPVTNEMLMDMFQSSSEMCCMPYVVASALLSEAERCSTK